MKKKLAPIITVSLAAAFAAVPAFSHARPGSAVYLTIPQDQEKPPEKPQEAKPPENPPAHEPDAKPPASRKTNRASRKILPNVRLPMTRGPSQKTSRSKTIR